jgi:hypothetical protein
MYVLSHSPPLLACGRSADQPRGRLYDNKEKVGSHLCILPGNEAKRCRYSEFEALRAKLTMTFPKSGSSLPLLPPKSLICRILPITCNPIDV